MPSLDALLRAAKGACSSGWDDSLLGLSGGSSGVWCGVISWLLEAGFFGDLVPGGLNLGTAGAVLP